MSLIAWMLLLPQISFSLKSNAYSEPTDVFEGTIQIGQNLYTLACDCAERSQPTHLIDLNMKVDACAPSRASIHLERKGDGLEVGDIEDNYGQARHVLFADARTTSFQCSDDRWGLTALYTPGGELAEFLLALSILDSYDIDYDVGGIMDEYMQSLPAGRTLTFCTDEAANDHLQDELSVSGFSILSVADALKAQVIKMVQSPHNQGDPHLRNIAKDPAMYHLRPTLLPAVMEAALTRLWSNTAGPISLHVHAGESAPGAILDIRESDACTEHYQAAMARPRAPTLGGGFVQAYILNGKAIDIRRQEMAAFIAPRIANATQEQIINRMRTRGDEWFEITIRAQLPGPLYTLTLLED